MKLVLEIRAAEGGDDSKYFAEQLISAYLKLGDLKSWKSIRL